MNKTDTVRKSVRKQEEEKVKSGKQTRSDIEYPASAAKKTDQKTPDEPYKEVLAFSEIGEISLFMNKN